MADRGFGVEFPLETTELDERGQNDLRNALAQHGLVVIRGQRLSFADQQRVMGVLGPVLVDDPHDLGVSYVTNVNHAGGSEEITWHYDLAYCPEPFRWISLHAVDVTPGRTSTRFVSGVRACEALPADLVADLRGLTGRHVYPGLGARKGVQARYRPFDPAVPHTLRPVVCDHPATGRAVLSVSFFTTDRIIELPEGESSDLLGRLFDVLYAPENTVEHFWSNGDLLIWDNRSLQHCRSDVLLEDVGRRILQKVAVADRGQAAQFPQYTAWRIA
jgi:taurine dioxygenase